MKSIKSRKQRKELFNAPIHKRRKWISAHLEENLLLKYDKRGIPVIKGDTVRVMRGSFKGHEDKVVHVNIRRRQVEIEGMTMTKADNKKIAKPIHASNLMITKLNLTDKWRRSKLESDLSEETKKEIEKEAKEQIKEVVEEEKRKAEEMEEPPVKEPEEPAEKIEETVKKRTEELVLVNRDLLGSNQTLSDTVSILEKTQHQLIQSEKMAGLGTLVAGVAHEINTPLGVAITAITYLEDLRSKLDKKYNEDKITRDDLEVFLSNSDEVIGMIINNLIRASNLIVSFKQVSVDQTTEAKRTFDVKIYLEELLLSLHPKLKQVNQKVTIICKEHCRINSFPGAFSQLITNFIMNSLKHAYEPKDEGQIIIKINKNAHLLEIEYSDDGLGMTTAVKEKIFEPFFTTKRTDGGTGLGLHIVYNIVTLQLEGQITCYSEPDKGTRFIVEIPLLG